MSMNNSYPLPTPDTKDPLKNEELSQKLFQCIRDFFFQQTGNWLNESKKYLVLYRLSKIIGPDKQYKTFQNLCDEIHGNPEGQVVKDLITLLTTHYSYFFRETEHFTFYQNYLIDTGRHLPEIRVWSAACSTGEEPYSLAIATKMIKREEINRKIKILATDISRESVEKARKGEYSYSILKERLPASLLKNYFIQDKNTTTVISELKEMIRFRYLNLLAPLPFRRQFQIIFLRNVLYYLDENNKKTVIQKITDVLEHRGYLVLGHMDTMDLSYFPYKSLDHNIFWRV